LILALLFILVTILLALGLRPRANTTALGQITVPISNLLFNNIQYWRRYIRLLATAKWSLLGLFNTDGFILRLIGDYHDVHMSTSNPTFVKRFVLVSACVYCKRNKKHSDLNEVKLSGFSWLCLHCFKADIFFLMLCPTIGIDLDRRPFVAQILHLNSLILFKKSMDKY